MIIFYRQDRCLNEPLNDPLNQSLNLPLNDELNGPLTEQVLTPPETIAQKNQALIDELMEAWGHDNDF